MASSPEVYPPRLSAHSTTRVGDYLYVIGGSGSVDVKNDAISVFRWSINAGIKGERWEKVETKGNGPGQRWGHSVCDIGEGKLLLFGGFDNKCNYGDGFFLNTNENPPRWSPAKFKGKTVHYRAYHSAVVSGDSMVLFGGCFCDCGTYAHFDDIHILNLKTLSWSSHVRPVQSSGGRRTGKQQNGAKSQSLLWPSPRSQHSAVMLGTKLVIIGGYDGHKVFADTFVFNLKTKRWSFIPIPGSLLPSTYGLNPRPFRILPTRRDVVVHGTRLYVVGNIKRFHLEPLQIHMLDLSNRLTACELQRDQRMSEHFPSPPFSSREGKRRRRRSKGSPGLRPRLSKRISDPLVSQSTPSQDEKGFLYWRRVTIRSTSGDSRVPRCSPDNPSVALAGNRLFIVHTDIENSRLTTTILRLALPKVGGRIPEIAPRVEGGVGKYIAYYGTERVVDQARVQLDLRTVFLRNNPPNLKESKRMKELKFPTLLQVGSKLHVVHKDILTTRSDFFKAMWNSRMREGLAVNKPVKISPTSSSEAFQAMLRYIYAGDIDFALFSEERLTELLQLADQYGLETLRESCQRLALGRVTKNNIGIWLKAASRFHCSKLSDHCLRHLSLLPRKQWGKIVKETFPDIEERRKAEKLIANLRRSRESDRHREKKHKKKGHKHKRRNRTTEDTKDRQTRPNTATPSSPSLSPQANGVSAFTSSSSIESLLLDPQSVKTWSRKALLKDMASLYKSQKYADVRFSVELKVKNGEKSDIMRYSAHKWILEARGCAPLKTLSLKIHPVGSSRSKTTTSPGRIQSPTKMRGSFARAKIFLESPEQSYKQTKPQFRKCFSTPQVGLSRDLIPELPPLYLGPAATDMLDGSTSKNLTESREYKTFSKGQQEKKSEHIVSPTLASIRKDNRMTSDIVRESPVMSADVSLCNTPVLRAIGTSRYNKTPSRTSLSLDDDEVEESEMMNGNRDELSLVINREMEQNESAKKDDSRSKTASSEEKMKEKKECKKLVDIELKGLSTPALDAILRFIYTGELSLASFAGSPSRKLAYLHEMLSIAKYLGMRQFSGALESLLCEDVDESSAISYLGISQALQLLNLQKLCIDTIAMNKHKPSLKALDLSTLPRYFSSQISCCSKTCIASL